VARPVDSYLQLLVFYFPLGVIGIWRWGGWLVKRLLSLFYKPSKRNFHASVSVVTPVYNEDPDVFRQALASWRANNPLEIIAVIDYTDENCIKEFEEFSRQFDQAKLIITEKPGKRPALADGIRVARGKIIALADSDALWSRLVLREALRPFADPKVGGVAVRQNVLEPQVLAQNIFDIQLDLRFFDEIMGLNVAGKALTCFSGRTAFYRRKALMPVVDDMVNETFWGKRCIGGDDKRLTYLIEAAGWKGRYQHTAYVYTPGAARLSTLFKQRTRWARNTWRADLRALRQGWVWKHPFLAFVLVDRLVSPLALLLSLMYFIVSLIFHLWLPAAILFVWWFFSRGVRIIPNLQRHPRNIRLVPAYVFANFAMAIVKIYSLLTLNRQDWITRRGAERAPKSGGVYLVLARIATLAILAALATAVAYSRGVLSF
jgi:cellulose synthase/poly-beta-1,6-N-acetylglucosamine synthase-like glycosyltransferase